MKTVFFLIVAAWNTVMQYKAMISVFFHNEFCELYHCTLFTHIIFTLYWGRVTGTALLPCSAINIKLLHTSPSLLQREFWLSLGISSLTRHHLSL